MIHLAFEASLLQERRTGLGQYAYFLLQELQKSKELKITLMHWTKEWHGPNFGLETCSYYWFKSSLAIRFKLNSVLKEIGADVFHAPGNTGIPPKVSIPAVVTIADLYALLHSKSISWKYHYYFKLLSKWVVKGSSHIICISQQTFDEVDSYFSYPREQMTVSHLGPCKLTNWQGTGDYFLCVGALEERKGQAFLCDAYLAALQENAQLPKLILVGPDRGDGQRVQEAILKSQGRIVWLNYVEDSELEELYQNCQVLLIPSQYEGFGLPLLEGILSGVPVLCSDIAVFHEVGQEYANYCSNGDLDAWKVALLKAKDHSAKQVSQEYRQEFSWQQCAHNTVEVYKKVLQVK